MSLLPPALWKQPQHLHELEWCYSHRVRSQGACLLTEIFLTGDCILFPPLKVGFLIAVVSLVLLHEQGFLSSNRHQPQCHFSQHHFCSLWKGCSAGDRQDSLSGCAASICGAMRWLCRLSSRLPPPGNQIQDRRVQFWCFKEVVDMLEGIHKKATGLQVCDGCLGAMLCWAYQRAG